MICPRCGLEKEPDTRNPHICVDCAKVENSRYSLQRRGNEGWMDLAAQEGIDVWLRQPNETQWEYTVWQAYRDAYPGKKPTYMGVAEQLNTTYGAVKAIAMRWDFTARLQAWITECDRITMAQRRQEILDMNKEHVDMAARLRAKLSKAIDLLDPTTLEPKDINSLFKTAAELERKARTDSVDQDALLRELQVDQENPALKKSPTKTDDLGEVVKILMSAGALGDITHIGVRETREVVLSDGKTTNTMIQEE